MRCNLCGGTRWRDMGKRKNVRCVACGSLERTRAMKLVLDSLGLPKRGQRVLHLAPEQGLSDWFAPLLGDGYEPADYAPEKYPYVSARKLDLCRAEELPSNAYDLILHNHVLEHVPCDLAHPLEHLHRALKLDGLHIFSVPLSGGRTYDECLTPLPAEQAIARFGQRDHVRLFGTLDFERHLGALLALDRDYSLHRWATADVIETANIPPKERQGLGRSTIFIARKHDYQLSAAA